MLELPPLPLGIRLPTNTERDRLKARYPRLSQQATSNCVTCRDKGEFRWWATPERSEVADWKCNCVDQWILHRAMLSSNIKLVYQRLSWPDMTSVEEGALVKVWDYLDNTDAYVNSGMGLILFGGAGTGKTGLASLILKDLLAKGHDCYFTTFSEMIDTYTGGWNDREERAWFHKRIKNAGVLVLDDVGKEYQGRAKNGLPESTFDEVLRHRIASAAVTIVTTNHDMKKMQEGYGGGVMSLLQERSTTYEFTSDDFRVSSRERNETEARSGLTRPLVLS